MAHNFPSSQGIIGLQRDCLLKLIWFIFTLYISQWDSIQKWCPAYFFQIDWFRRWSSLQSVVWPCSRPWSGTVAYWRSSSCDHPGWFLVNKNNNFSKENSPICTSLLVEINLFHFASKLKIFEKKNRCILKRFILILFQNYSSFL